MKNTLKAKTENECTSNTVHSIMLN